MCSAADGAVELKMTLCSGGHLQHEQSCLELRKQLGHLPGSPRARGLQLVHRSFKPDPTSQLDGKEILGARRAIDTIQNVFRHSLGTNLTLVKQPRSHLQRFGHARVATNRPVRERASKTTVYCTHYREVRPTYIHRATRPRPSTATAHWCVVA